MKIKLTHLASAVWEHKRLSMQADFLDSHQRHWSDAEQLFQMGRWANADHLYGVTTECGLKRLMHAFGMALGSDGSPTKKEDRKHANGLWLRFESYRSGHLHGTGYVLSLSDPFIDWDVSQRYANQSNFDQARAQSHQAGAKAVCDLIKKAQREGLI